MAKRKDRRILLAQNFIKSGKLAHTLVSASSIGPTDLVYEIGAGRGILTAALAETARRVVALEKDPALVRHLSSRFSGCRNVEVLCADFLHHVIREHEYKIFANIPFNRTADIVRKVLTCEPCPREAGLILQKEAAHKFAGVPRETQFSVLAKPYFNFRIAYHLRRTDFDPVSGVDSVLLLVTKKEVPLVRSVDARRYRSFIQNAFGAWRSSMKSTLKSCLSYRHWLTASAELGISSRATPSDLTFEQWLGLFRYSLPSGKSPPAPRVPD